MVMLVGLLSTSSCLANHGYTHKIIYPSNETPIFQHQFTDNMLQQIQSFSIAHRLARKHFGIGYQYKRLIEKP